MELPVRILDLLRQSGKLPARVVAGYIGITPAEALHRLHGLEIQGEVSQMNGFWFISPREARLTSSEVNKVLDIISGRGNPGVTVTEIALILGYSSSQIEQAIRRLVSAGRVRKSGHGSSIRWVKLRGG
ncbi:MarR family transcriptional regulator [Salmonella enterica]|nr:MarR family transcriptional regulator [Salmonella enterica]EKL9087966.1 MarR family transcriptional regulator [Salmonella enterica]